MTGTVPPSTTTTPATPGTGRLVARPGAALPAVAGTTRSSTAGSGWRTAAVGAACAFERVVGHWFGPLALNTVVSFGTLLAITLGSFLASWPEAPPTWIIAVGLAAAVAVPLAFFPWSRTLWLAVDLRLRPLEPGEAPGLGGDRGPAPEGPGRPGPGRT